MRACLLAALPNRAFPPPCGRDARVPSTRDAGSAGVPPAMPTAREKNYPFKGLGWGLCLNLTAKTLIIPIAEPEFTKVRMNENPLLKVPPASRGNRTRARFPSRSGGNLQEGGNCKLCPRDWYNTDRRAEVCKCVGFESPLIRGERAGSGGLLHAQELVNFGLAIGISTEKR